MSSDSSMSRRHLVGTLGAGLAATVLPAAVAPSLAQTSAQPMQIKKFNVTVERFDPANTGHVEQFILPVDCPDSEHAASAVLSNLIAWTPKTEGSKVLPIAFRCIAITERAG